MPNTEATEATEAPQETPEVDDFGAMSFEEAMKMAVQKNSEELGVTERTEEEPAVEEPPEPTEPTAEAQPEVVEPPAEEQVDDKSLARIMEREQQLLEKQAKYDQAQDQLNELRGRLDAYEMAQRNFLQDPVSAIRAMAPDIDLKRLAEGLWYENQGDAAPAKYLQEKAATRQNVELSERLAKLEQGTKAREQAQQEYEAQQTLAKYQGALEAYAESIASETHPLTAAMHAKNPQMVSGAMFNIARNHAQQTGGQVLTNEQLADAFEKELSYYQLSAPSAEQAPKPTQAPGTSLRNNSQQVQSDRAEVDELSDEFLHEQAMKAARMAAGLG